MAKNTTAFTKTSKNTADFSKNQSYDDTRVVYDSDSRKYDSASTRYDGVDPTLSPIIDKNQTDFARGSKTETDFSLNQDYDDTKVDYDDSSILYGSSAVNYAGVDATLSPIGTKQVTDHTPSTKNTTDWDAV